MPRPEEPWRDLDSTTNAQFKTARARVRSERPTAEMQRFSQRCRQLRAALKLDQETFGQLLGVKGRTVSRWETISGHLPQKSARDQFNKLYHQYRVEHGDPKPTLNPSKFRK